jgi:response regulator RpfG family c-di-GMP phosphodiesterase
MKKHKVILARKTAEDRKACAAFLGELGFTDIIEAGDGKQAKTFLQKKKDVALLVCGDDLAEMSGPALLAWMRKKSKKFKQTPVLILGDNPEKIEPESVNSRTSMFLTVPFNVEELQTCIDTLLPGLLPGILQAVPKEKTKEKKGEQGALSKMLFEKGVGPGEERKQEETEQNGSQISLLQEEIRLLKTELKDTKDKLAGHQETYSALFRNGLELLKQDQFFDAAGFFNVLLLFEPENIKALNNMAVIYFEMAMEEKARKSLERILEIDPDNALAKENLSIFE